MSVVVEAQSICYILSTGSLRGFKPEWFIDYKDHFLYIQDFYRKYNKVPDKVTFVDKFSDFKIFQVNDPISSLVERLKENARYKMVIPIYNKAYELITQGKSDQACKLLLEKIGLLDKALSNSLPPVDLTDPDIKKRLYKEHSSGITKISTGRPELDNLIGGWNNKDYIVIFARLGNGKSWISEYFAYNLVKNGLKVGYYSGEMSPLEVSLRLDTFNTHNSNLGMFNGRLSESEYSKVADSFSALPGKFYAITPEEVGGAATVDDLKKFIENYRLQALFIDQISLMKKNSSLSKTEALNQLADDLRILQSTTGIPFFIVSQQNRQALQDKDSKNRDDLMASINYSDALGQNATLAFYLDYNKENKLLTINVAKSRRSDVAKFHYSWKIDTGELTYIPSDSEDDDTDTEEDTDSGEGFYGDQNDSPF